MLSNKCAVVWGNRSHEIGTYNLYNVEQFNIQSNCFIFR